jgi:hypothetical protein
MPLDVPLVTSKHRKLVQNMWFSYLIFRSFLVQISIHQDWQYTRNVILMRYRAIILAVDKQNVLHILSVYL